VLVVIAFRAVPLTSFLPSRPVLATRKKRQSTSLLSRFRDSLHPTRGRPARSAAPGFVASEAYPQYRDGEPGVKTPPSWPSSDTYHNYIGIPNSWPRRPPDAVGVSRVALEGPSGSDGRSAPEAGDMWKLLCQLPPSILHISDPRAVHPTHVTCRRRSPGSGRACQPSGPACSSGTRRQ
jgi:hypothetical protein